MDSFCFNIGSVKEPIKSSQDDSGGRITSLIEMVWLFVANLIFFGRAPRLWPPVRRFLVTSCVRMCGLLLWLHGLNPCLGHKFASCLLAVFEARLIKQANITSVSDLDALPDCSCYSHVNVVIFNDGMSSPWSFSTLSRWRVPVIELRHSSAVPHTVAREIHRLFVPVETVVVVDNRTRS